MDVFIDTNILLGLYKLTGPDLDEVKRLIALAEKKELQIHINENIVDEFYRNREGVIGESMQHIEQIGRGYAVPNLAKPYAEAGELRDAIAKMAAAAKTLSKVVGSAISDHKLKADEIVYELFSKLKPPAVTGAIYQAAILRQKLGKPPGKGNGIGDALNWEWLLYQVENGSNLHVISADGDYQSTLDKFQPKDYLLREWKLKKNGNVILHRSLLDFLNKQFPDFKLSDEIHKANLVIALVDSFNFAETHKAIAALEPHTDFSESQLVQMLEAITKNTQINWILTDDDVKAFGLKLIGLATTDASKEAAAPVIKKLQESADESQKLGAIFSSEATF